MTAAHAESPQELLRDAASQLAAIPVVREPSIAPDTPLPDLKNWEHAARLFERNGVPRDVVLKIFSDPRMPQREALLFSLEPKESAYNYRKLNKPVNRKNALAFYAENRQYFRKAAQEYPVPESVILAILQVERPAGGSSVRTPFCRVYFAWQRLTLRTISSETSNGGVRKKTVKQPQR